MIQAILIPPKNQANRIHAPQRGRRAAAAKPARAKASLIERMNQRRFELWRQLEEFDDAQALLREAGTKQARKRIQRIEQQKDALLAENDAILEALSGQRPRTPQEIIISLDAAANLADAGAVGSVFRMIGSAVEALLNAQRINGEGFLPSYCAQAA